MAAKVTKLSEMLAKRRETLGSDTRFEWPVDDEKSFQVLDPRLASDEWRDDFSDLGSRFREGLITPSEFSEDVIAMFLDDEDADLCQSDDYLALFEEIPSPLSAARELLQEAVQSWTGQTDPTRKSSRSTRRSAKQH